MSDKATTLRALALARADKLHPMHIVLDDDLRDELAELNAARDQLQTHRRELVASGDVPAVPASLGEKPTAPTADIDRHLHTVTQQIADAEQRARESGTVLVLNFRRLPPATYQQHVEAAETAARKAAKGKDAFENAVFMQSLGDALFAACYAGATDIDGTDAELTVDELTAHTLTHTDLDDVRAFCIHINRETQSIPFSRGNSGPAVPS